MRACIWTFSKGKPTYAVISGYSMGASAYAVNSWARMHMQLIHGQACICS